MGRPAENLPPRMYLHEDLKDKKAEDRWFKSMFASEVAAYAATQGLPRDEIIGLRGRQAAAASGRAARSISCLRSVGRGWAPGLAEALSFRLRDTTYGAPPLLSPLPHWKVENRVQTPLANEDLLPGQKQEIHVEDPTRSPRFLGEGGKWADNDDPDGAFVGGVVHTMEFPSELVAVLRNPIGTKGRIDSLAFTALGANAHMVVAFDEGRTIFVGETLHGQLARLIKIRIGRVAVLWNRARHVIVYERSAVPGMQFVDEQEINGSATSRGWPILRKAEEYVEPIERVRAFADEAQVKDNRAGFIRASEFMRVYVNGAWGRDIGHGYEIPLWNEADESGFYPKPALALQAHAGGAEVVRCLPDEPQHLYFIRTPSRARATTPMVGVLSRRGPAAFHPTPEGGDDAVPAATRIRKAEQDHRCPALARAPPGRAASAAVRHEGGAGRQGRSATCARRDRNARRDGHGHGMRSVADCRRGVPGIRAGRAKANQVGRRTSTRSSCIPILPARSPPRRRCAPRHKPSSSRPASGSRPAPHATPSRKNSKIESASFLARPARTLTPA